MQLWKEARAELRSMRQELMGETDEDAIEDIRRDMAGLQKKKNELAKFLGIEADAPEQIQHVDDMAHAEYGESLMETKLETV